MATAGPAFGPASAPSSDQVSDGLDEDSMTALQGIQAGGAGPASALAPSSAADENGTLKH